MVNKYSTVVVYPGNGEQIATKNGQSKSRTTYSFLNSKVHEKKTKKDLRQTVEKRLDEKHHKK